MRLGDLDALKEVIKANHYLLSAKNNSIDYGMFTTGIMQAIDNAPTVPLPDFKAGYKQAILDGKTNYSRQTGEWIIVKDEKWGDNVKCPFCGKELAGTDLNFCCKCGADMRGKEE